MKKLVIFRAEKARKRLMPLAFSQWHLPFPDFYAPIFFFEST